MRVPGFKTMRHRKSTSRNGRAEEYSKRFRLRLRREVVRGMLPRLVLVLVFVSATVALFPPTRSSREVALKPGDIADRTIIAPFEFEVPLSAEELQVRKADALLKVLPVYTRDVGVETGLSQDLSELFDSLATAAANASLTAQARTDILQIHVPYLPKNLASSLLEPRRLKALRTTALDYQRKVFARGLLDNAGPLRARAYTEIAVIDGGDEKRFPVDNVIDQGSVDRLVREESIRRFGRGGETAQLFTEIVRVHLRPNLILDAAETQTRRDLALSQVEKTVRVAKNQRIISNHERVTEAHARTLRALHDAQRAMTGETSRLAKAGLYAGEILKLVLFCLLVGGYIFAFRSRLYRDIGKIIALLLVFMIFLAATSAVVRFGFTPYLIPVALVSVMVTSLFDFRFGMAATVFTAVLMSLVTDVDTGIVFVSLLAGAAAIVGLLKMRSRSHFYTVFLAVTAAYLVGIVSVELGREFKLSTFYTGMLWATVNALFCSLIAMFLLPIFEAVFNITTRFTLLELTDLNNPLLKRLNMEAPGTYHHAMLLGNLVDTVAAEIGADPLKARVMAYYHDIGKLFKPEYYSENQEAGFNKHEKITPQMSKTILVSHVKDGVELARDEKLPDLVVDAIQQHHGTTVMAFFYQKALETDSHSSVNKDDFRYPGPRPSTREAALLMLADTVEPACRSLKEPTPSAVRNMVIKLINARSQEGELDECGLTLNDLAKIKEKFVAILTSLYHKRVAYPGQEEKEGEAVANPA
jgi:putative nucleotidyltransferase with HDIG domain